MIRLKTYDIKVEDSLFDPNEKKSSEELVAYYKKYQSRSKKTYYKVFLYVSGKDLPFIKKVSYKLHKTFRNPVKTVERKPDNPNCSLVLWTWGLFNINIEVEDINGGITHMKHYLSYGNEIKNEKNIKWKSSTL